MMSKTILSTCIGEEDVVKFKARCEQLKLKPAAYIRDLIKRDLENEPVQPEHTAESL